MCERETPDLNRHIIAKRRGKSAPFSISIDASMLDPSRILKLLRTYYADTAQLRNAANIAHVITSKWSTSIIRHCVVTANSQGCRDDRDETRTPINTLLGKD